MNTEQSKYNSLKAASFQISDQIMSYCDHINSVGGNPTYSILRHLRQAGADLSRVQRGSLIPLLKVGMAGRDLVAVAPVATTRDGGRRREDNSVASIRLVEREAHSEARAFIQGAWEEGHPDARRRIRIGGAYARQATSRRGDKARL